VNTAHSRKRWFAAATAALVVLAGAAFAMPASAAELAIAGFNCVKTDKANGGFTLDCDPAGQVTPSPSASPVPSPSTVAPTPSPSPSTATPSPSPSVGTSFPTASSVGVPAGWAPATTRSGWTITAPGVYSDVRVNGSIQIRAQGVTLRRVEVVGGVINTVTGSTCYNGLVLEDVTVRAATAGTGAVGPGGYTARRVALLGVGEGFRIGGRSDAGCGPVSISDSYVRLAKPTTVSCGDWHGDAVQGYDAPTATIRNTTLDARDNAGCGTAGVFYGDAEDNGNQPLTVVRLLVFGGVAYRPDTPHSTEGLRIVDGTTRDLLGGDFTGRRATRWVDNAVSDSLGNAVRPIVC
jgi:hypothetical protein